MIFQYSHRMAVFVAAIVLLPSVCAMARSGPPNIVIILADDLGYGDVSCYGGDITTPNIDALMASGVRFTNGYVAAPVCNPSRAALLSGRHQQRWGQELNSQTVPPNGSLRGALPLTETTFAQAIKVAGYQTAAIGKWQLGMANGYHPRQRGFDYFFGMSSGSDYIQLDWPGVRNIEGFRSSGLGGLFRDRTPVELTEYLTDLLTSEAVGFIERNKQIPFLLYLAHFAPHVPLQVTDEYWNRFPQFDNEIKRVYAGMIAALDDGVGKVIKKLAKHQLADDTLVIFLSDNGAAEYIDVDSARNKPLTGHKRNLYEGGIRIPFAMHWKGKLSPQTVYRAPVSSIDIFPTVLAAAVVENLDRYKTDGVNLLPHLLEENRGSPHQLLYWRSGPNAAVRRGPWKLLLGGNDVVRLYHLEKDPGESKDLSAENPEIVRELKNAFDRWNSQMVAPRSAARKVKTQYNDDEIEWHI